MACSVDASTFGPGTVVAMWYRRGAIVEMTMISTLIRCARSALSLPSPEQAEERGTSHCRNSVVGETPAGGKVTWMRKSSDSTWQARKTGIPIRDRFGW